VRQPEAQVPAHRQPDHLGWEPEPGERRTTSAACGRSMSKAPAVNATEPRGCRSGQAGRLLTHSWDSTGPLNWLLW
jgi:hypothetical protein